MKTGLLAVMLLALPLYAMADDVSQPAHQAGEEFKSAGKNLGHGNVGEGVRQIGHGFRDGAKTTGHAIRKGAKATGHAISGGAKSTKKHVKHAAHETREGAERTEDKIENSTK